MILFKFKLKELRMDRDLSQIELATALNVSQRSISNWETGSRRPDFEALALIAKFFEVTTDYLLGLED